MRRTLWRTAAMPFSLSHKHEQFAANSRLVPGFRVSAVASLESVSDLAVTGSARSRSDSAADRHQQSPSPPGSCQVESLDGMIASWLSTVLVICMLSSATVAIRISNPNGAIKDLQDLPRCQPIWPYACCLPRDAQSSTATSRRARRRG